MSLSLQNLTLPGAEFGFHCLPVLEEIQLPLPFSLCCRARSHGLFPLEWHWDRAASHSSLYAGCHPLVCSWAWGGQLQQPFPTWFQTRIVKGVSSSLQLGSEGDPHGKKCLVPILPNPGGFLPSRESFLLSSDLSAGGIKYSITNLVVAIGLLSLLSITAETGGSILKISSNIQSISPVYGQN